MIHIFKRKLTSILILFILISFISCSDGPRLPYWLEGTWASGDSIGFSGEAWTELNDTMLIGEGLFNMPDNTILIEELNIFISGGSMHYAAIVPDQNEGYEIIFTASYISSDSLVFENPEHDYPKKIIYIRKPGNKLQVMIIGDSDENAEVLTLTKL